MTGGTFTISNVGIFGSMLSTPVINPPQSAILGVRNIVQRPVTRGGEIVSRPVMYAHRLVDGREAATFLVSVRDKVEGLRRMLLRRHI